MTRSLVMKPRVKTTPSSWAGSPICLEKISLVFVSWVSPPSLEYRVFLSRRSFYGRKVRERALEARCRTWNRYLFFLYSPTHMVPLFAVQEQANGTSATFPATASICPTRVNEDGRRSHWTLATLLQVSFRYPRTISGCSPQTSTLCRGWFHSDRRPFGIPTDTIPPRAAFATAPPLSNTTPTECTTAYTISITSRTYTSGRCTELGSNEDGTPRANCWWEINECRREEETEEREGSHVARNGQWWRRCPWCRERVGWRWNERSYQHERGERCSHPADDCGRISTRECWRNYRRDAGVDYDSDWDTWANWYNGRCTHFGEEEGWAREGEEGEDGYGLESCHRYGVVIVTPFRSCFWWTFNLYFTPRSLTPTLSYLHSLSLCTFAHFIRSLHQRIGLVDTCRLCV